MKRKDDFMLDNIINIQLDNGLNIKINKGD